MFRGLNVFPLTPLHRGELDEGAFTRILGRLQHPAVQAITLFGSTGAGPYLTRAQRLQALTLARDLTGEVPFHVGVGALTTRAVLEHVDDAASNGACAILLPAMSYQPLREAEVIALFQRVSDHSELPIVVYDNPTTTGVRFTLEMYARVAALPAVRSIKIPALPNDSEVAAARVRQLREVIPERVSVGISGDAAAAAGLAAGCDGWYSVIGGTLPEVAAAIMQEGEAAGSRFAPLFDLFTRFGGSIRVAAAIATLTGLTRPLSLPEPLRDLEPEEMTVVQETLTRLGLL